MLRSMFWIIALVVILSIIIVIYRRYANPPLSSEAEKQRQQYVRSFHCGKALVYQMEPSQRNILLRKLEKAYIHTGANSYSGNRANIAVEYEGVQTTILLFCESPDDLARNIWKVLKLKKDCGGTCDGASLG